MTELFVGLMSGTSLDGVDGVIVDFSDDGIAVLQHASVPFPARLRSELMALNTPAENELHRAALAANALAKIYSDVTWQLLGTAGLAPAAIRAIGVHGQTVRHQPGEFDGTGYTLQLGNPSLLAELTSIDVVADFRSRDVAAGGQGAPLVPAFHRAVFGRDGSTTGVLNIGGISNLSILPANDGAVLGFDCGPGNALMDFWCQTHTGQPFDAAGVWAASGRALPALMDHLLAEPYFSRMPPKSTGRDLFNPVWLSRQLVDFSRETPVDVQATLTELTARVCADSFVRHGNEGRSLIVCGGGALNDHLMTRLGALLPWATVSSSAANGMPPLEVEAAAFAWLARRTVRREPGNMPSATGARGERVLGAVYPA